MKEQWKPVVGYEGNYEVSSLGRVKYCVKNVMCVETKEVIDGIKKAERMFNIKSSGIHHAIKRNGTAGGYHWVIV